MIISNDMEKTVISSVVFENIKVDPSIDYRFFACYDSNDGHGKIVVQRYWIYERDENHRIKLNIMQKQFSKCEMCTYYSAYYDYYYAV